MAFGLSTPQRRGDGPLAAGTFEGHVERALPGAIGLQLRAVSRDIDDAIGTDPGGFRQHRVLDVRHDDLFRSVDARGDDRQRADRPATRDEDSLAEERAGAGDGMKRDGEGLGKGGNSCRDAFGDLVALPAFGHELLAKGALDMGHRHRAAVKAHVEAVVLLALEAIFARVARPARRDGHPVADRQPGDAATESGYAARYLMTENHRLANTDGTEASMLVVVKIRAADAADLHCDLDLTGTHGVRLTVLDAQVALCMNYDRLHGYAPIERVPRRPAGDVRGAIVAYRRASSPCGSRTCRLRVMRRVGSFCKGNIAWIDVRFIRQRGRSGRIGWPGKPTSKRSARSCSCRWPAAPGSATIVAAGPCLAWRVI